MLSFSFLVAELYIFSYASFLEARYGQVPKFWTIRCHGKFHMQLSECTHKGRGYALLCSVVLREGWNLSRHLGTYRPQAEEDSKTRGI